eukprot:1147901-Pelagomonas_calceolata.AAC.5
MYSGQSRRTTPWVCGCQWSVGVVCPGERGESLIAEATLTAALSVQSGCKRTKVGVSAGVDVAVLARFRYTWGHSSITFAMVRAEAGPSGDDARRG